MVTKYKHITFFIAGEEEFSSITGWEDIFAFMDKYNVYAGYGEFDMVFALSRLFFGDDEHIPKDLSKNIPKISRLFLFHQDFIEKIASFECVEMDVFGYKLREDKYCKKNKMDDMGIWVLLYQLYDCCKLALEKNINLYLVEETGEDIEDILER